MYVWHRKPECSPTHSRMSSPEPAGQQPQEVASPVPPAPPLPPAHIPQVLAPKTGSPLDIDFVRLLSIQGLSDDEETLSDSEAIQLFSPLQPPSPSTLLAEADLFCGSLPNKKNYKEAHEQIAQDPGLHITSELTTPNFKPHQPRQRRTRKNPESPHSTPKKAKTAPAAGDSTEKQPKASSPKAPHDMLSPLEYCVLRSAQKHNPRTYMQGKTSAGTMMYICEMTAKQNENHYSIMQGVMYACVIYELW